MARKKGLGKGLEALFEDNSTPVSEQGSETVKISEIVPNKNQPRKDFDQAALEQLADSIKEHGIIQPLILRPLSTGGYQIVAGERRYRASRMAGLTEIPAIVREFSDTETMEIALIENLQRENLNPIEEALGYRELMESYNFTQEAVSKSVGKSRPVIANALRLLNLPDSVIEYVQNSELSAGHARALLAFDSDEEIERIAKEAIEKQWTVRDLEKLSKKKESAPRKTVLRNSFYDEMELALTEELGRKISVKVDKKNHGSLTIEFYSKEDLKALGDHIAAFYTEKEEA